MKCFFLLLFYIILSSYSQAQTDIEYNNKFILKTLQKKWNISQADISILNTNYQGTLQGRFYLISKSNSTHKYMYIGRVNSCRAGGCSANNQQSDGNSEYFDYFMVFDSNLSVELVKVFNYAATHGQEVTAKSWLKQFQGYNGDDNLQVNKNIDSITGATISVYALTNDVEDKTRILHVITKKVAIK